MASIMLHVVNCGWREAPTLPGAGGGDSITDIGLFAVLSVSMVVVFWSMHCAIVGVGDAPSSATAVATPQCRREGRTISPIP